MVVRIGAKPREYFFDGACSAYLAFNQGVRALVIGTRDMIGPLI